MATSDYILRRFVPDFAAEVASWVRSPEELFHLAPTTPPPLTAEKVIGWAKPTDRPCVLVPRNAAAPCGYAELNPTRQNPEHLWIGHVIVDPAVRGGGIGRLLVQKLVYTGFVELKAERISLVVFPDNETAVRCYVNTGFEPRGEEYHRFGPARRRYRMLRLDMDRGRVLGPGSVVAAQWLRDDRRDSPNA